MLGPVHQVGAAEGIQEHLLIVGSRVGRVNPVFVVENNAFGVGVPAGKHRIARHGVARHRIVGGFLSLRSGSAKAYYQEGDDLFHRRVNLPLV